MSEINSFDDDRQRPLRRLNLCLQWAAGAGALAILASGWIVGGAFSRRADDLAQTTAQALSLAGREAQIRDQHTQLTARVKEAQLTVAAAQARLGDSPQESRFIAQLTELAEEAGLDVSNVRPGSTALHGSFGILELKMAGDGTYESLCAFLTKMDQLPRICHVSGMNVALADPKTGMLRVDLQLQLLFALPGSTPSAPQPLVTQVGA